MGHNLKDVYQMYQKFRLYKNDNETLILIDTIKWKCSKFRFISELISFYKLNRTTY